MANWERNLVDIWVRMLRLQFNQEVSIALIAKLPIALGLYVNSL